MSVLSPPANGGQQQDEDHLTEQLAGSRSGKSETGLATNAFRKMVIAKLDAISGGCITLCEGESSTVLGDSGSDLQVAIEVHDSRLYRALALGGSVGAGEAYRDGYWSCDDLVTLVRIFGRNLQASAELGGRWNWLVDLGRRATHRLRRNTRSGSRRNIAEHYDLSNEFYSLFLDDTMTYSSGVFPHPDSTMREASVEKYERICQKLQLSPRDKVLEIGTGWGGFALHAAANYGCHVTTTTISRQQFELAQQRFKDHQVDDRINLLFVDYRDLTGAYDKLVSIEMIEAVGHEYFDTYFAKCSSLLKPDGLFALQAITIPDQRYDHYRRTVDFIQKYIFPGGCLPSLGAISSSLGNCTDLQIRHLEDFAEHYARTLNCWRSRFRDNLDAIRKLGMTDQFLRLWDYYLSYCEGAFREKQIGVSQILLQKPGNRRDPKYPSLG